MTFDARESAVRLGALLADITSGLAAEQIHALIVARLQQPEHDQRLASLVADDDDFATMWTGLAQGQSLPEAAWETVVLPTIVAFSDQQSLKTHLERATSLWLATHPADQEPALPTLDGEVLSVSNHDTELAAFAEPVGPDPALTVFPTADLAGPKARQLWPRSLVALALAALITAGGFWWLGDSPTRTGQPSALSPTLTLRPAASATPGVQATAAPVVLPSPGAPPTEPTTPSTLPPPPPTWNGPGPAVAPSAPLGLTVSGTTTKTVTLAWQAPADPGSGTISYYRIFRDGTDTGWTDTTNVTIGNLASGVSYAFHVVAYNTAGLPSPPSGVVTATTATGALPATTPPATFGAAATIRISPQPAIPLGNSFAVIGSGWPCAAPAQVRIVIGGRLVALAVLSAQGGFTATVTVDNSDPEAPHIDVLDGGEAVPLAVGTLPVTAALTSQPSCELTLSRSTQVVFR